MIGLGWTAEMFGYVFAASELGIRHEIWNLQVDSELYWAKLSILKFQNHHCFVKRICCTIEIA
jgi:hypothetical protein